MSRLALGLAVLAGGLGILLPASPGNAEALRAGANVRVNAPQDTVPPGQLGRVGMAVAASADGRQILAGWDDIQGMCGAPMGRACPPPSPPGLTGIGASNDGGATWTDVGAPPTANGFMSGGHVWIDRGGADNRTFYVVSRGRKLDDATQRGQIGFLLSRGRFENGVFAWIDSRYLGPAVQGDYWRGPTVAAAKDGSGRVYVALSNLHTFCGLPASGAGQIEFLRSPDGGSTWEAPVVVGRDETFEAELDAKDPQCAARGRFQFTPTIALGLGEQIYLVWQYGPLYQYYQNPLNFFSVPTANIRMARSLDGGRTFGAPRDVVTVNSMNDIAPAGYSKDAMNDTPRIAVAQAGPHRGRLYISYAAARREVECGSFVSGPKAYSPVSSQAYVVWSDDRGENWSHPVPLGDPVPETGVKRFFPAVAVGPDGAVDAVYFESRETQLTPDPLDVECSALTGGGFFRRATARSYVDLWWTRSTDGGATFGPRVRATSETSDWCDTQFDFGTLLFSNFADYLGIFPGPDGTLLVWSDGRNGIPDAYFTRLGGKAK